MALIAILFTNITITAADESSETLNGVIVEDAVLEPGKKGDTVRLRFKISNYTNRRLSLTGVQSPVARAAVLTMKLNDEGFKPVDQVHVLQEETLNLQSSHIRIQLLDLRKDIGPGAKVEFELIFNDIVTPAVADVH